MMTTGTKVFLALFALIVGVLVIYYGVAMPSGDGRLDGEAVQEPDAGAQPDDGASNDGEPRVTMGASAGSPPPTPQQEPESRRMMPAPREPVPIAMPPAAAPSSVSPNGGLLTEGVAEASGVTLDQRSSGGGGEAVSPNGVTARPGGDFLPLVGLGNGTLGSEQSGVPKADVEAAPKPEDSPSPAVPTSQPSTAVPPARIEYIISEGDTFVSIADEWFGDESKWSLIARENPTVDPQRLKIGQKIYLPPKKAGRAPIERDPVLTDGERLYVVQSGDTLIAIARDELGDQTLWEDIYALNKSTIGSDAAALKVGMKLKLPRKAG